jgi:hypothetical protein
MLKENKKLLRYPFLIFLVVFCAVKIRAQSLPISSYGVWDRGGIITNFSDPNVDFVKGIEASEKWENIEHVKGTFNFSSLQTEIDKAVANNILIRLSVEVGPDSPLWMYDDDTNPNNNPYPQVQKVTTSGGNDKVDWPIYPEYLSQTYQNYLWEFLNQFSNFIRSQPQEKFSKIAFVQVKTGCTGDEVPYKGNVDNSIYRISDNAWYNFRKLVFGKYKLYFNDVPDKKIVLTFNDVDPSDPNEVYAWNWLNENIDPAIGFGIKGGAFNRGHHLSSEQSYKESLYNYLVNPKTSLKLFSASEMDQTALDPYFQICPDLSYYWAALAGLNVGLSTNNLNATSMNYVLTHPSATETFRMFTRYAQQVYPATATTAFSIFHDGLNSADKNRFSESKYGNSNMNNVSRYKAICNDPIYQNRGARIDDTVAVIQGQVFQRAHQTGLNDAGWEIAEGNIERFFTQINPNETSIGLFRVRGEITTSSSKYDRFARSFENATGKNTMYFKFDTEVFTNTIPTSLNFKIIWLDKTVGSTWSFRYKSTIGLQKNAIQITGIGDNTWKEVSFTITDAVIDNSGINGSDFTLLNTDNKDDIFNGIEVGIVRGPIPTLPVKVSSFNAKLSSQGVFLDWVTNSETNNDYFEILRSAEDKKFISVYKTPGAGNSSNLLKYSFLDKNPLIGNNYYQLKQTCLDGTSSFFPIIRMVNNPFTSTDFHPYFIGSTFNANIYFNSKAKGKLKLYNTNGVLLFSEDVLLTPGNNFFSKFLIVNSGVYIALFDVENKLTVKKVAK